MTKFMTASLIALVTASSVNAASQGQVRVTLEPTRTQVFLASSDDPFDSVRETLRSWREELRGTAYSGTGLDDDEDDDEDDDRDDDDRSDDGSDEDDGDDGDDDDGGDDDDDDDGEDD